MALSCPEWEAWGKGASAPGALLAAPELSHSGTQRSNLPFGDMKGLETLT